MTETALSQSGSMVPVGYAYGAMEAALAFSILDSAGVIVHVDFRHTGCNAWHWMIALGGMPIFVPSSQALDASGLLTDFAPTRRRRWVILVLLFVLSFWQVPPPSSGFFALRRVSVTGLPSAEDSN